MIVAISVLSIAAGVFLIAAVAFCCLYFREKGKNDETRAGKIKVRDGVRYTADDAVSENGRPNVTLNQGDFLLEQGKVYTAVRRGALLPGSYTALAASEKTAVFKLRLGGYVREYGHGDTIVLAEGEEICAVSCNVILR